MFIIRYNWNHSKNYICVTRPIKMIVRKLYVKENNMIRKGK